MMADERDDVVEDESGAVEPEPAEPEAPEPAEPEPAEQTAAVPMPGESDRDESAFKISVGTFHGPLDLLLHLIKKHDIDIYDIPIVLVTEQYNTYLDAMQSLDLDIAADYIYMAALLIHIKSKMLLPREDEGDEATEDPRKELVDRLVDYQRFKAVAETFAELDVLRMGVWSRPQAPLPGAEEPTEIDMSEVSLFDLVDAFRTALARYKQAHPASIELKRVVHKVSDKMGELYLKVREKSPIRLQWFLEGRDRNELVAIFLGMLELVRLGGITLQQKGNFGEILVAKGSDVDPESFKMFDS